jgi:ribosomal protein S18 acetylase RimI-like enzyme
VLAWVHEAGNPYFDFVLGGGEARSVVATMMRNDRSEIAIRRAHVLLERERPIGGFIALPGHELPRARQTDLLTMMKEVGRDEIATLRARLAETKGLFPPVAPEDYYLSKMGLLPEWRGQGLGKRLLKEYVAKGEASGFRRFSLDVSEDNRAAVNLYRAAGFEVVERTEGAGMAYLAMRLVL